MDAIIINGTQKLPTVNFDASIGKIEIKGKSIPEDSIKFYKPLVSWIAQYRSNPQKITEVHVQLEYFNTATSKCLTDVFKEIEAMYKDGNEVLFNWYYNDEYIMEAGEDYQSFIKIPFKMIAVAE
ncbi:MAG: DUF1987 domain-containing protein [Bacteroidia bacterium]|nr:DUF1987 domain-containing protein [Bacteroidia bacterium]